MTSDPTAEQLTELVARHFGPCPKCGWAEIIVGYRSMRSSWNCPDSPRHPDKEHFDTRCTRCSYRGVEAVTPIAMPSLARDVSQLRDRVAAFERVLGQIWAAWPASFPEALLIEVENALGLASADRYPGMGAGQGALPAVPA